MSSKPVRRAHTFFARLTAVVVVATGVPVLIASAAPADTGPGSSPDNPITITTLAELPAGAVETGSSLQACATVKTYTKTVPAVVETTHAEYRWPLDKRTYSPGQQEVSHQVYSYKKTVQDYKTQWFFAKYTHTKTKPKNGSWSPYGPWTKWLPETHTSWEDSSAPLGTPALHGSGTYQDGTQWYREWQAQSTGITRQVANGSHLEYSGEVLAPLGSPWVLLPGYPKKVIDSAAVPPSFTAWGFDAFTAWSTSNAAPADPDGQDGEANPLNLRRVGSPMESRTVGNNDAKPAVSTYYRYSDGKVCEVVTPTPTPTPVVTPTPTPTPTPEVLGVQAGRATGKLYTSCQGTVRATMKNASSSTVTYKIKVGKKVFTTKVKADKTKAWSTKAKNLQTAKLMIGNRVLAKAKVPKACLVPEVLPETGKRQR